MSDKTSNEQIVDCGCSEYPECVHVLYFYQGYKRGCGEVADSAVKVISRLLHQHGCGEYSLTCEDCKNANKFLAAQRAAAGGKG